MPRVDEAVQSYLTHLIGSGRSAHTVAAYRRDVLALCVFLRDTPSPPTAWGEVDHRLLRRYLAHLRSRGGASSSVRRYLTSLSGFFGFLLERGLVDTNPVTRLSRPKLPRRLPLTVTVEELGRLFEAIDLSTPLGVRDRAVIELLYAGGLRVSELTGLDLDDLDLPQQRARVLGKRNRERLVPYGDIAAAALQLYLAEGRPALVTGTAALREPRALFIGTQGQRLSRQVVCHRLKWYSRQAGLTADLSPHSLRHCCATHMLDRDADLRSVQELLGHTSLSSTQIYTHVSAARLRRVYDQAHPRAGR